MSPSSLLLRVAAVILAGTPLLPAQENSRTWEVIQSPTTGGLMSVNYGNGYWLAFGDPSSGGGIFRSANGIAWQQLNDITGLDLPDDPYLYRVRFVKDRFLVRILLDYTLTFWKQSTDGRTWTDFPVPPGGVVDVTFANGQWVCVGYPGLFAHAETPGNWSVYGGAITSSAVDYVIHLGGRFHAFTRGGGGLKAYSSADGSEWSAEQESTGVSFDSLSYGEIELPGGAIESVVVGSGASFSFYIGRASGNRVIWETRQRSASGKLIPRRSADVTRPGFTRREWVAIFNSSNPGPLVYTLAAPGETPVTEDRLSLNRLLDAAAGPDAMIAVGTGGLIRRYPTGLPAPSAPQNFTIRPAVELKWDSRTGASYQIEESDDMQEWKPALPATFTGTGQPMTWTAPRAGTGKFYRVRES